jgi:hypothetical protein
MSTHDSSEAAEKEAEQTFSKRLRKGIARFGVAVGVPIFVVVFVLVELHIIDDHHLTMALAVGLIVILSEQVHDASRELAGQQRQEHEELGRLHAGLAALNTRFEAYNAGIEAYIARPRLYMFLECMNDLGKRLKRVKKTDKLVVQHLGLDMDQAWDEMAVFLHDCENLGDIEYRLVMMAGEDTVSLDESPQAGSELQQWRQTAAVKLLHIHEHVDLLKKKLEKLGRTLQFEVRTYSADPVVHGIRIVAPDTISVTYLGICRWRGDRADEIDWGPRTFQIIDEASEVDTLRDLVKVFCDHFQHHWHNVADGQGEISVSQEVAKRSPK